MIDKNRLEQKCSTWNISLTGTQLDQLDAFAEILVEYNQKVNLTAITDPEGIEDKHFLDSLLFASQPEVAGKMVDVGAGAGFPGIVTKIYKPELELTLMEPTGKRVEFLKYACGQLGLTGVEFSKERAEEAARKVWREQFDLASARAVAALPMLAEYCLPLVKVGGQLSRHERRFRRGGAERCPRCHQEAGRRVQGDPHPPPAGRRHPHPHPLQKDFANSDSLPQKWRQNRKKPTEITLQRKKYETPCRTKLLAGCFIFWYTGDGTVQFSTFS